MSILNFSLPVVLYKQRGQPASLTCQVSAVPVPTITWAKLNKDTFTLIKTSQSRSIIIDGFMEGNISSSLVFSAMSEADLGQYLCNATNLLGTAATSFTLRYSPQSWSTSGGSSLLGSLGSVLLTISINRLAGSSSGQI